ncbi:MAG TPA: hypothetical protein PLG94_17670 [Smithellaceae bacterium]|nr:hypothetical protein [Smithellaceae bacterium]
MGSNYDFWAIEKAVRRAIEKLKINDADLLDIHANERSVSHKLAEYLQQEFNGRNVVCEYNRQGSDVKRLIFDFDKLGPCDLEAKTVFPDIIVHRRMTDQNLIVMEVIKSTGPEATKDIEKLKSFTGNPEYRYKHGMFLKLGLNSDVILQLYKDGELDEDWTVDLKQELRRQGYGE